HTKPRLIIIIILLFIRHFKNNSNVSCYRIEPGTIAGIICADVLLTLVIVIVTYRCASFRRRKIDNADKVYMNVRANCKS
uniref:Hematopoietic cell signal transducer n=1 Tax=Mastacembelus armatus TaxID=205130 RepID=A0A7N8XBH6_9TELE